MHTRSECTPCADYIYMNGFLLVQGHEYIYKYVEDHS